MANDPTTDLAIAGGAIMTALLDLLVHRGDLTTTEILEILGSAQKRCAELRSEGAALVCGRLYLKFQGH